ncbi:MAG: hypothetical protein J07AB43_03700 [Candidatus Nanosalina sp. J07AB43]|nr:MAG: hypothetical protein J07AB43_03700 [Candidatus Nanosalina sp. J07AB43]
MKGFFFSLDSLLAASIMLASFLMVLSQPVENRQQLRDYRLDRVHTANMQPVQDWNSTYNTSNTVTESLMINLYNGSRSRAEDICSQYFNLNERYGIFTSNSTENTQICGKINIRPQDNLISETSITPIFKVNESMLGPRKITMVIRD